MTISEKVERVRLRLKRETGKFMGIALKTDVNYHWIVNFAAGRKVNPSLTRVAILECYFKTIDEPEAVEGVSND